MKLFMGAAALIVGLAFAGPAMAQGKQDFTLVNKTGYRIEKVYVSPTNSDDWDDDVLGRDVLDNGESVHITFNRSAKTCKWDLKVVYDDDEKAEWESFDLCQISKINIHYNRSSGQTSATYE